MRQQKQIELNQSYGLELTSMDESHETTWAECQEALRCSTVDTI